MKKIWWLLLLSVGALFGKTLDQVPDAGLLYVISFDQNRSGTTYNLEVDIPAGFKSIKPLSECRVTPGEMIEFIPKGEKPFGWTEIITITNTSGHWKSAEEVTKTLGKELLLRNKNGKMWQDEVVREGAHQKAIVGVSYDDYAGRHETMKAVYFSGKDNSIGVQYTIRSRKEVPDEEIEQKLNHFFQNVKIRG